MKLALFQLSIIVAGITIGVISSCKPDESSPPTNHACMVAKRMALSGLECDPIGTNMGWLADTCICQLGSVTTDATGKTTRTATQVIWVKASLTDPPEVKSVYQIPSPPHQIPPSPSSTQPHKE